MTLETMWFTEESEKMADFLKDKMASNVIHANDSDYFLEGYPVADLVPNPLPILSLQ